MQGRLIDFWRGEQVPAEEMARGVLDEVADDAASLGCTAELELVEDLLQGRTGANRQLEVVDDGGDLRDLVRELCARTRPE